MQNSILRYVKEQEKSQKKIKKKIKKNAEGRTKQFHIIESEVKTFEEIKKEFNVKLVDMIDKTGGEQRSDKGGLVVELLIEVLSIAAIDMGLDLSRVLIETKGKTFIPFENYEYLDKLDSKLREYFLDNIEKLDTKVETDVLFRYDGIPILAIEAKAYSDATMFKRYTSEIDCIKSVYPTIEFVLFQLEDGFAKSVYVPDVGDEVCYPFHALSAKVNTVVHKITMLEGQRDSKHPIHSNGSVKTLSRSLFDKAVNEFKILIDKQLNRKHVNLSV